MNTHRSFLPGRTGRARRHASRRILPLVLLAFFTLVASAQANHVSVTTACNPATGNTVTFNWVDFKHGTHNGGRNQPLWKIVYTPTGGLPITYKGQVTFTSINFSLVVPIPSGAGTAVANSSWTATTTAEGSHGNKTVNLVIPSCLASPAIATTASASVPVGGTISDSAVLSGGRAAPQAPTGTITFRLYLASDTTCSNALSTGTATVNGNGTYTSPPVTENKAGTYQWTASYSGDANNKPVTEGCNASTKEQVVVTPAAPSIVTTASGSVAVGGKISDAAVLSGGISPTGTITFNLYKATDTTCSTSLSTATVTVTGNGIYNSPAVTENTAGTYQWTASYSGDSNNKAATEGCNASTKEQVVVTTAPIPPNIVTTASPGGPAGSTISDQAVLGGGTSPTGTITFNLYAASDTSCATSLSTATVTVTGNGIYNSPAVTENTAGTYQWTASYSGDGNNASVTEGCNSGTQEQVTVVPVRPAIVTTALQGNSATGSAISDRAVLSGGSSPTGTITFKLYLAGASCSSPVTTSPATVTVTVNGNGTYTSPAVTVSTAGTYQWVATYSGDANNASVTEGCGQVGEQVKLTTPPPKPSKCTIKPHLKGVFGKVGNSVTARVGPSLGIKSVTFYLDGRKVGTVTKPRHGFFTITINTKGLGYGHHTVTAKVKARAKVCKRLALSSGFIHSKPHPHPKPTG